MIKNLLLIVLLFLCMMLYSCNFNLGNETSIKLPAMLYITAISPAKCFLVRNAGFEGIQDQKE